MTIREMLIESGVNKGRQEGRQEERLSIARNMNKIGMDLEMIAKYTSLPMEKLKILFATEF